MASPNLGSQLYFAIKKESVVGTAELVPNVTLPINSNGLNVVRNRQQDSIAFGSRDALYDDYATDSHVEGEVTGRIRNDYIGNLLALALSVTSAQEGVTGAYKHIGIPYNLSGGNCTTEPVTFTAFYSDHCSDANYTVNGCVISELKLTIGVEESTFSATIMGRVRTKVTGTPLTNIKAALAYTDPTKVFLWSHLVVKSAPIVAGQTAAAALAASTTYINLQPSLTLTIKNNAYVDNASASTVSTEKTPYSILFGKFEFAVETGGTIVRDDTLDGIFSNDTAQHYEFLVNQQGAGGAELGTASTLYPLLRFRVSSAKIELEVDRPVDDKVIYSLAMPNCVNRALDGKSVEAYFQNTTASY